MRIGATLRPGQKGTRGLLATYGERLVCVRYRYDLERRRRLKTVELVVEEQPWVYSPPPDSENARRVTLRARYDERDLHARLKRAGARWDPEARLWSLPLGHVRLLGLTDRIVPSASTRANPAPQE